MIYIEKGEEPQFLSEFKRKNPGKTYASCILLFLQPLFLIRKAVQKKYRFPYLPNIPLTPVRISAELP